MDSTGLSVTDGTVFAYEVSPPSVYVTIAGPDYYHGTDQPPMVLVMDRKDLTQLAAAYIDLALAEDAAAKEERPMILTLDAALDAIDAGTRDWATLTANAPRNALPAILENVFSDMTTTEAAYAAAEAWQMCEFPENALDRDVWLEIFDNSGFIVNGAPAPRPRWQVVLYRGGEDPHRMAWTADRAQAEWFRDRFPGGRLWTCIAPPDALLAHFDGTDGRTGETEYVVDPAQITTITEVTR